MAPGAASAEELITIDQLSGYKARWRLVARVTKKTTKRTFKYKQKEGEGQMFSIDLVDCKGKETRCTFFGQAVDNFFDVLEERRMYSFSGGKPKKGDRRFCKFDHEITFDEHARISPVDDDHGVPQMVYDFKPISSLPQQESGSIVDIAAVVAEAEPPREQTLKAGGSKQRQDVTLIDDSGASCRLTLWGDFCESAWQAGSVVLIKGARVSDYGGRSLNTINGTACALDAQASASSDRAIALSEWYRTHGSSALQDARSVSSERGGGPSHAQTIEEVKAEGMQLEAPGATGSITPGAGAPAQHYHTVSPATITYMPHEKAPFYMACPCQVPDERNEGKTRSCNRKMEQTGGGQWACSADHQCPEPTPRWVVNFSIADHTGSQYVSCFDELGGKILGCQASEAAQLFNQRDVDGDAASKFEQIFKNALYKRCRLRIRSKKEVWNDEERLKVSAIELAPLDIVKEGRQKLAEVLYSLSAAPKEATGAAALPGGAVAVV